MKFASRCYYRVYNWIDSLVFDLYGLTADADDG